MLNFSWQLAWPGLTYDGPLYGLWDWKVRIVFSFGAAPTSRLRKYEAIFSFSVHTNVTTWCGVGLSCIVLKWFWMLFRTRGVNIGHVLDTLSAFACTYVVNSRKVVKLKKTTWRFKFSCFACRKNSRQMTLRAQLIQWYHEWMANVMSDLALC